MVKDKDTIIEKVPIMPTYVTGIGTVQVRHGTVYLGLTAEECRINKPGVERVLVARLVMPVPLAKSLYEAVIAAIDNASSN